MRQRHVCPKCQNNRILLIDSVPDTGEHFTEIRHLHVAVAFAGEGWLGGERVTSAGKLSAAVCKRCGYTELYANSPELIPVDGRYVREVVGPESSTPYR